jgi:hypothetical protein
MFQSMDTDAHPTEPRRVICARCGADFGCSLDGDCWCRHVAVRLPMPAAGEDCLCPHCLQSESVAHSGDRARD